MATYRRGVPYEVGMGPSNSEVVLFAGLPAAGRNSGFEPATGHWRQAGGSGPEIDTLWEVAAGRHVPWRALHPCWTTPANALHIAYLGTDARTGPPASLLAGWTGESSNCSNLLLTLYGTPLPTRPTRSGWRLLMLCAAPYLFQICR